MTEKMEVKAHVKPESLTTVHSSTGNVTGIIYFSSGSFVFPEEVWDDLPVAIAGMWLDALAEYLSGTGAHCVELAFMDGPFYVLLSLGDVDDSSVRVEMVRSRSAGGDQVEYTAIIDVLILYESIDEVAGILIEFCERQPNEIPDYPELVEARRRARDAVKRGRALFES